MAAKIVGVSDQLCGWRGAPPLVDPPFGGCPPALDCDLLPDCRESEICVAIRVAASLTSGRMVCPNAAPATARNPAAIDTTVGHRSRLRLKTSICP